MAPQKETIMIIKVDLDCPRCYKKVKKLLCSIPQIQDQMYKEKQNTVMIKVVCCSPEKIRDKIRCKGGKTNLDIQIVEPPKPPSPKPDPPKPPSPKPDPPKPSSPKPDPPKTPSPKPEPPKTDPPKPPTPQTPAPPTKPDPPKPDPEPKPVPVQKPCPRPEPNPYYPQAGYPGNVCCSDCYHGRNTGPCYNGYGYGYGYGVPSPPPPPGGWVYYDGCPPGGYGYRPGYCVSRCADYINDENPTACVIM